MPTPSLLIVPARFKSGKLYSQIPTSGAGDFTVTRATNATRVNASGFIESVASGIPRLDYFSSDGTVGCPALLVEPAATNLAKYSDQFDTVTSGWLPTALQTITGNTTATLDPAGGNTADLIVATTGTTTHNIRPNSNNLPAFVSGTTYTYSVFAKATSATSGFVQIYLGDIVFSPVGPYANFQLSGNGAVTTGTYSAASIQPFGNGWYRCSITATAAANGVVTAPFMPILASGTARAATFAGNGVDGVYLWGAQLETGSVATSYIPTTTASVTRNADVVSVSGAVSGSIGQTQGTIYAEVDIRNLTTADFARIVTIRETANSNNFFEIEKRSSTQLRISARLNSGSTITFLIHPNAFQLGTNKIAFAYQDGNYAMGFNGVVATSAQAGMTASLNQIILGASAASGVQFNDRILDAALYTTRLSNAQLAALTSL
jgi:hypothetical protein